MKDDMNTLKNIKNRIDTACAAVTEKIGRMSASMQVLCVSLLVFFVQVRFNVNLMLVVLLWALWKAGFFKWLGKTFGEKETRTALSIFACVSVGYAIIMLLFKIPMSIDIFFDTDMTKWHHMFSNPFAQLPAFLPDRRPFPFFYNLPFGLFTPTISDLSVRLYMVLLSALNVSMFSLFISRIAPKARVFNILLCTALAVSAPQLFFGALGVEQYMHTQFGMMVCMLYFSFAIPKKRYKEWELLLVSFVCLGANSILLPMFGLFYIALLYVSDEPKKIFLRIFRMGVMFLILHHLLAFGQSIILPWVNAYIWNMLNFLPKNLDFHSPYDSFSAFNKYIGYPDAWKYIKDVLSMPFGFDFIKRAPVFPHIWLWAVWVVALVPCAIKGWKNPLFLAIFGSWISFVLFFSLYNPHNSFLYSVIHTTMLFAMLAYLPSSKFRNVVVAFILVLLLAINAPWVKYINSSGQIFQWHGVTTGQQVGLARFSADSSAPVQFNELFYDNWLKAQPIKP